MGRDRGLRLGRLRDVAGYLGGQAFEREPWKGFLLAFGFALAVTGIVEIVRAVRRRRAASSA